MPYLKALFWVFQVVLFAGLVAGFSVTYLVALRQQAFNTDLVSCGLSTDSACQKIFWQEIVWVSHVYAHGEDLRGMDLSLMAQVEDLRTLDSLNCKIDDEQLRVFAGLAQVEVVDLTGTSIGDVPGGALPKSTRHVMLLRTHVGDETATALAELPRLSRVYLSSPNLTDAGVIAICDGCDLECIVLESPLLTDVALGRLCEEPGLRDNSQFCRVLGTFSDESIQKAQEVLKGSTIRKLDSQMR